MSRCYCCSGKSFAKCCEPLVSNLISAANAEELMRSRFSAYCLDNFQYILDTYGELQRPNLTVSSLAESAANTHWIGLEVLEHQCSDGHNATVEFVATYAQNNNLFQMHELSSFELQEGQWKYTVGVMKEKTGKIKISRNAPCPCQSGKKFKQCCMKKL